MNQVLTWSWNAEPLDREPSRFAAGHLARRRGAFPERLGRPRAADGDRPRSECNRGSWSRCAPKNDVEASQKRQWAGEIQNAAAPAKMNQKTIFKPTASRIKCSSQTSISGETPANSRDRCRVRLSGWRKTETGLCRRSPNFTSTAGRFALTPMPNAACSASCAMTWRLPAPNTAAGRACAALAPS